MVKLKLKIPSSKSQMLKEGTFVRVLYPEYAQGIRGQIVGREDSGRWIVQLAENPVEGEEDPFWLSVEESELEVLEG